MDCRRWIHVIQWCTRNDSAKYCRHHGVTTALKGFWPYRNRYIVQDNHETIRIGCKSCFMAVNGSENFQLFGKENSIDFEVLVFPLYFQISSWIFQNFWKTRYWERIRNIYRQSYILHFGHFTYSPPYISLFTLAKFIHISPFLAHSLTSFPNMDEKT